MLKLALAQINPTVGDIAGNARKILAYAIKAKKQGADLVIFSELVLCGYPPEDLLLKKHFLADIKRALQALAKKIHGMTAIVGFVDSNGKGRAYNAAVIIADGKIKDVYYKRDLPNYGVFDEKRYFARGGHFKMLTIKGVKLAVNICEDMWVDNGIYKAQAKSGADILINISSSPYHAGKLKMRQELLARRAGQTKTTWVYVNAVGGQDELVFDGGSMVVSSQGEVLARAKQFEEQLLLVSLKDALYNDTSFFMAPALDDCEEIYKALVLGTRDYALKNGFKKVALGLSGGIDSALVACIAADAFGKEHVTAISMPSVFSSQATRLDSRQVAENLGIEFKEIAIDKAYKEYLKTLHPYFVGRKLDTAEENIQARIRGNILMAFANKFGALILTTGNKSEMAVGYCTLYGDMSGGYAVIKDVFKTKVYQLARWRNAINRKPLIPESILNRAPSAELRHHQTDEETLGAYKDLDRILMAYIERHASFDEIVAEGLEPQHVLRTIRRVDANEYKRRQAPPGVKITPCAFGKDWRLPITNQYKK